VSNKLKEDRLKKTPNFAIVKSPHIDICGKDDLFQGWNAREDVTTAFETWSMKKSNVEGH
jgi:hypothetical protein